MVTQACDQALDFYLFDELLSDDERLIRERVRRFCDEEVIPIITLYCGIAAFV